MSDSANSPYEDRDKYQIAEGILILDNEQRGDMLLYGIDDAWDADNKQFLGFACMNCGAMYPTIEDRKLKDPDECDGCIQKSKWG